MYEKLRYARISMLRNFHPQHYKGSSMDKWSLKYCTFAPVIGDFSDLVHSNARKQVRFCNEDSLPELTRCRLNFHQWKNTNTVDYISPISTHAPPPIFVHLK